MWVLACRASRPLGSYEVYAKNYVNLTKSPTETIVEIGDGPILQELYSAFMALVDGRATDAFCSYDTPVSYDVFNKNGGFVTPWVDDPDFMWFCAAEYLTDSCSSFIDDDGVDKVDDIITAQTTGALPDDAGAASESARGGAGAGFEGAF